MPLPARQKILEFLANIASGVIPQDQLTSLGGGGGPTSLHPGFRENVVEPRHAVPQSTHQMPGISRFFGGAAGKPMSPPQIEPETELESGYGYPSGYPYSNTSPYFASWQRAFEDVGSVVGEVAKMPGAFIKDWITELTYGAGIMDPLFRTKEQYEKTGPVVKGIGEEFESAKLRQDQLESVSRAFLGDYTFEEGGRRHQQQQQRHPTQRLQLHPPAEPIRKTIAPKKTESSKESKDKFDLREALNAVYKTVVNVLEGEGGPIGDPNISPAEMIASPAKMSANSLMEFQRAVHDGTIGNVSDLRKRLIDRAKDLADAGNPVAAHILMDANDKIEALLAGKPIPKGTKPTPKGTKPSTAKPSAPAKTAHAADRYGLPTMHKPWWDAFTKAHGGKDPVEFYSQGPRGQSQPGAAIDEAMFDKWWSEQWVQKQGQPINDDVWRDTYWEREAIKRQMGLK